MIYLALLRNHWKSFGRSFQGKRMWLISLALIPVVTYVVLVLVGLGLFFGRLVRPAGETGPLGLLNAHLLTAFFGMLAFRFFFQRPPRMEVAPYLHLPIERRRLSRYFQAASLASVHNVYPLLFFVPFWSRYVQGQVPGAGLWLAGIVLCLLLSHYLNTLIRVAVDRFARPLLGLAALLVGLQILDQALGTQAVSRASAWCFDALAAGNGRLLLLLATLTLATLATSSQALRWSLRAGPDPSTHRRQRVLPEALTFGRSPLRNLVLLEIMMMWRNKRPRQYVLISIGVSTAYTALLLSDYNAFFGSLMAAAVGLFASGVFALNYGQLMFAWESRYFDGFLSRDLQPQHLVLAKFMVLQGSCLLLFIVSLPLFFWLAPDLLMLHVAFLFYNAGVTSLLMLTLAVFNRRRVNAAEGSFFNYQGFSILHWLWILPTILPPALLLYALEGTPETALSLVAMLGLVSMLMAWPSSRLLARLLTRRKYLMAAGFRIYDR